MRHLLALLAFALLAWGGQRLAQAWSAPPEAPLAVWLVLKGPPGAGLKQVLAVPGTRLVRAWWGGRVVQLRVDPQAAGVIPPSAAWWRIEGSQAALGLPGCG